MTAWDVMLVSHEASRTGAPRVALNTVEWLVDAGLKVLVVIRSPGPMLEEFRSSGAAVYIEPLYALRIVLRRFKVTKNLAGRVENLAARIVLHRLRPNKTYLNSILSLSYAKESLKTNTPTIVHLHETGKLLDGGLCRYKLDANEASRITWIACAHQATQLLSERYPDAQALHWPSCVDEKKVGQLAQSPGPLLPRNFILGVGKGNRGKGFDIWIRLCQALARTPGHEELNFVWVGNIEEIYLARLNSDDQLASRISFPGELANPYPVMKKAMLLTVTSRTEASPLVTLEAQALGVPVVAFDVGDIKDQIPPHHLVRAENEADLLTKVLQVLNEKPPVLAFDHSRHGIAVARQRALALLGQPPHPRIDN